jgi:hypothetical protein
MQLFGQTLRASPNELCRNWSNVSTGSHLRQLVVVLKVDQEAPAAIFFSVRFVQQFAGPAEATQEFVRGPLKSRLSSGFLLLILRETNSRRRSSTLASSTLAADEDSLGTINLPTGVARSSDCDVICVDPS